MYQLYRFLTKPIFQISLKVKSESVESNIAMFLNCPLCKESEYWKFPKERNNPFGYHYANGITWKPEKGHKDYELHNKLKYHFSN